MSPYGIPGHPVRQAFRMGCGQGRGGVNFEFECGLCGAECVAFAERGGFWNNRFYLDSFWCWNCGEENSTPPGPWTPAD